MLTADRAKELSDKLKKARSQLAEATPGKDKQEALALLDEVAEEINSYFTAA